MDNRGTPAPSNSQIRQTGDALFPNRRGTQNVEDHEPSSRRRNADAEIVAHENNQAVPIVISSGSEDEPDNDAAYEEAERRRKGKMAVSSNQNVEAPQQSESESDSEDDPEYQRQLNFATLESWRTQNLKAPEPFEAEPRRVGKAAEHNDRLGAEYERQLLVAIEESWKSYNNSAGRSLDEHALRTETGLARGNIGNDSTSNPAMDLANVFKCPNEDRVDEGVQTETHDAVRGNGSPKVKHVQPLKSLNGKTKIRAKIPKLAEPDLAGGKFINSASDTEATGSMPLQRVSSRGRVLKPTSKLLEMSNVTHAPAGQGTSGSERKEPKKHRLSNVTAQARSMPRIPVSVVNGREDAPLPLNRNRLQSGVAGVSEGPGSVVTQAGQANGVAQTDVVNPDGSGISGELGWSEPDANYWIPPLIVVPFFDPTSVAGQASEANAIARQTDMAVPLPELMVCETNQNPMDLTDEEADEYMRTE